MDFKLKKKYKTLILLFFIACGTYNDKKGSKKDIIDVSRIVKIIETSDFNEFVKYIHELSYEVVDSSLTQYNSLSYITREKQSNGNGLSWLTKPETNQVEVVTFLTRNNEAYEDIKMQIKNLNFKSSGKGEGGFDDIFETDEFENGNISIAVAVRKRKGGPQEYEVNFLNL